MNVFVMLPVPNAGMNMKVLICDDQILQFVTLLHVENCDYI